MVSVKTYAAVHGDCERPAVRLTSAIEQVFELPDGDLKSLEVEKIDITNKALISADDYKEELDPALVGSEKTGRGPLAANWEVRCGLCTHRTLSGLTRCRARASR